MNNLQLTELQPLIIEWAKNKNLLFPENAPKQILKLIEECGELASAILKNDVKLQKDAIGDIFVVLVILAEQLNVKIEYRGSSMSLISNEEKILYLLNDSIRWDSVDDSLCYLHDLSLNLKLDLTECANIAWNEIKNRTGQTVNGTFIKDEIHRDGSIPQFQKDKIG